MRDTRRESRGKQTCHTEFDKLAGLLTAVYDGIRTAGLVALQAGGLRRVVVGVRWAERPALLFS